MSGNGRALATQDASTAIEQVLVQGNLAQLTSEQRVTYYNRVCESMGLNPLTRPFDYITLNGKLTLYAKRDAADQLRKLNGVSIAIAEAAAQDGVYVVRAKATDKSGREDEAIGAVAIEGLKGEARANALMKAETKAKRRVTLSICGLGWLDESEVEGARAPTPEPQPRVTSAALLKQAQPPHDPQTGEIIEPGEPERDDFGLPPVEDRSATMDLIAQATKLDTDMMGFDNRAALKAWWAQQDLADMKADAADLYADLVRKINARLKEMTK